MVSSTADLMVKNPVRVSCVLEAPQVQEMATPCDLQVKLKDLGRRQVVRQRLFDPAIPGARVRECDSTLLTRHEANAYSEANEP